MWLIDRRYLRYFDWLSFVLIVIIASIGLMCVFSATYKPEEPCSLFFNKQLFGIISGLIIYCTCCCIDYRTIQRWGYFFYFLSIGLLVFTILKGSVIMGGQRWINIGIIKFQPSELVKLLFPSFVSYYLSTEKEPMPFNFKTYLPILIVLGISSLLIRKQPDLGTALLVCISGLIMLWLSGLSKYFFIIALSITFVTAPLLWHCLKPYQKKRIAVFLGEGDNRKERYQIEQSRIAVGSGGLLGKGFLRGTQNKLQFLPESRTDFIFSVLCEEWGFTGALFLIILYTLLFVRLVYVILCIPNFFAQLFATGLIIPIALSTIINIGMVIGLLPIVGIPLPLLSYGISHTWITFASLGTFNSIAMRRFYGAS